MYANLNLIYHTKSKLNSVALVRKRICRLIERRLSAKVVPTFMDRGRVVIATDPHGHILGFLDQSRHHFLQVAP
jgi:hypothetical protein